MAYADFYRWEWIKYSTAAPAYGYDLFFQLNYTFSEKINLYLRIKNENRDDKTAQTPRYLNLKQQTKKIRVHAEFNPSEKLSFKSRVEYTFFNQLEKEHGLLLYQDLYVEPFRIPVKLNARVAWFKTEGYQSRIYAYENDLLYLFSIPAYFGEGYRTYLNVSYPITRNLSCWFKLENTFWNDRETNGSGYNEIDSKSKTTLKFQVRLKI